MPVRDTDRGYKRTVDTIFDLSANPVDIGVGVFDDSGTYGDGTSVVEVAMYQEFGTSRIPERSFIRAYIDENEIRIREMMRDSLQAVARGVVSKDTAMRLLGQKIANEMKGRLSAGIPPPNAPSTVKQKGVNAPLVNTGRLREAIKYRVGNK